MTKEERKIYNTNYNNINKEKIKERNKYYYEINKEKIKEKHKNNPNVNKIHQKYKENNRDEIKKRNKIYRDNNKQKVNIATKKWQIKNVDKIKIYNNNYLKQRKSIDPLFSLKTKIRTTISNSLKRNGFSKNKKTEFILGCSFQEFKSYLESKFEPWMNWNNRGKYNGQLNFGWDIDHIVCLSSAKTEDEIIKLNHHTNLQPLCSYINRDVKRDNY